MSIEKTIEIPTNLDFEIPLLDVVKTRLGGETYKPVAPKEISVIKTRFYSSKLRKSQVNWRDDCV